MSQKFDVVILGSGISALTCAIILAQHGKSVVLLEKYAKPGGYMHSFKRQGETFETGAHYFGALGEGQPFRTLLKYLSVYKQELFTPLDPTGFDELYFPEGKILFPQGYENLISEISASFPNERSAIEKYFQKIREVVLHFPTYNYSSRNEMEMPAEALDVSLSQVVESITTNPRLQSVFYAYCNLHGVHPSEVAFGLHALVTDSLITGPCGLSQNGDSFTAAFVARIEELGGQVLTKQKVIRLNVENKNIKTVECENGETFSGDWIISSLHPKVTYRLASDPAAFSPASAQRILNMKESAGLLGVYGVANSRPPLPANRNSYFFRTSDPRELFESRSANEIPNMVFLSPAQRNWKQDQARYPVSLHSEAPTKWFQSWESSRYGKRSQEYSDFKLNLAKKNLELVDRYHTGFSETLGKIEVSTPLTNQHFNGSEDGSSYGIYHSIQNTGVRALGPRTKILNLLLTGQSCLFPGLMGGSISALRTSGHIVGIKPMLTELQKMRTA